MTPDDTPRRDASWKQRYESAAVELDALYANQVELSIENELLRNRLNHYEGSRPLRAMFELIRAGRDVFPVGSKRRKIVARGARTLLRRPTLEQNAHEAYRVWLAQRTPGASELERQRVESATWTNPPSFSVCMPVHTRDAAVLTEAITSVLRQSYPHWELYLCADGPPSATVSEVLRTIESRDQRVKVSVTDASGGISRATNEALARATGDFVAFLDDDDRLEPHALYLYAQQLQSEPDVDVLYCDEDVLVPEGGRVRPFLKPDWSPETALSMNFVTHFVAARRRLVDDVGGLRPERDGAQDHDLVLRLTEQTSAIRHIPAVLYSWRQSATSTSMTPDAKPWAYEAGAHAVQDALDRRGIQGRVEAGAFPGGYRVRYELPDPEPRVEILIPTRDRVDLLEPCIASIEAHTKYGNYSITVLDNDSRERRTRDFLEHRGLKVVDAGGPFNYSAIINRGFASTESEFVLTLNNDTLVQDPQWLGALLELGAQPGVGAVGCRLVFPDGVVQHEGIVIGRLGPAANLVFDAPGIRLVGAMKVTRDVSAVTGACCLIRRSAWEAIGGFDENFAIAYNDVDFCLRLRAHGYRVLYTPHVTLIHDESSSRGTLHPAKDEARLLRQWSAEIAAGDPFFPPGLRLGRSGLELAPGEVQFRGLDAARIRLGLNGSSQAG